MDTANLKIGQKLLDNDTRMRGRKLTITEVLPHGVRAKDGTGRTRLYLAKRIFDDGKPRAYGLSLIKSNEP